MSDKIRMEIPSILARWEGPVADAEVGVVFVFPGSKRVRVCVRSSRSEHITITGDDALNILPLSSNCVLVGCGQ